MQPGSADENADSAAAVTRLEAELEAEKTNSARLTLLTAKLQERVLTLERAQYKRPPKDELQTQIASLEAQLRAEAAATASAQQKAAALREHNAPQGVINLVQGGAAVAPFMPLPAFAPFRGGEK